MALIKCPDCGNEVSDKADSCPKCGYPIRRELSYEETGEASELFKQEMPYQRNQDIKDAVFLESQGKPKTKMRFGLGALIAFIGIIVCIKYDYGIVPYLGILFAIMSIVFAILALIKKESKAIPGVIIFIYSFFLILIIIANVSDMNIGKKGTTANSSATTQSATSSKSSQSPSSTVVDITDQVKVVVTGKKNQEKDIYSGQYNARSNLIIAVENYSDKAVKGVKVKIKIADLFGNELLSSNVVLTGKTVPSKKKVTYDTFGVDINEFIDAHKTLYNEKYDDLKFECTVLEVALTDELKGGTTTSKGSDSITVKCVDKKNISSDYSVGRYSPHCQFIFEVSNRGNKDIKGIEGVLTVKDLFGTTITRLNCNFTGTKIEAGYKYSFSDKYIEINEFLDDEVEIWTTDFDDMYYEYEITDVVYY